MKRTNEQTRWSAGRGAVCRGACAALLGLAVAAALCALAACESKAGDRAADGQVDLTEGPELFKGRPRLGGGADAGASEAGEGGEAAEARGAVVTASSDSTWTIALAAFRGEGHQAAAEAALERVRALPGLEQAFVSTRGLGGDASFVGLGRFVDPTDPKAQSQLARVREMTVGTVGERPFADAFMAPPAAGAIEGGRPEFNLALARQARGGTRAALVTLQVGVYERLDGRATAEDLAEIRKAAESAAAQLRREGEQAFYYHGQRRSMVTVGLFEEDDVVKRRSAAAAALRKRHPYNLLNGQGYKTSAGGAVRASEFVRVP
ncbi:MAG: hypothetical protein AB7K52_01125 [Phycisphaerales bacterium]